MKVLNKTIFSVLLLSFVSGCSNLQKSNSGTADSTSDIQASVPQELPSFRVSDPEPPQVVDKELDNMPPEMQPKVEQWIAYFQGKGRPHMERYLSRSTQYIQMMKRILRQNGLPEDIVYIALIESGFNSRATSRAAAVGFWQFIKGTGRRYNLEINSMIDERRDPVLATQAAAEYFKGLYSVFGSWYLSMASYNVGENRVKKEVMKQYTRDFWELARKRRLPKETVNYVPKFIAAKWIAKDPEKYGFSEVEWEKPVEFELIKVDHALNLKVMAQKIGMEYEDFKFLNPKFRGEIAPLKNGSLELRVPVGQKEFALIAAQTSIADKVQFIADAGETETYRVRSGDSLYTIARRYRTTVVWLKDVNDIKAGKKLKVGMRLQVPDRSAGSSRRSKVAKIEKPRMEKSAVVIAPIATTEASAQVAASTEAASNSEIETSKGLFYIVQQGDTLSSIADEYDSTIRELRKMNKLGKGSLLRIGMKLRVPKEESLPTSLEDIPGSDIVAHTVKAGENLTTIAKQYGVTVEEIREANKLKKKSKINAGMTLNIPVKRSPSGSVYSRFNKIKKQSRRRYQARTKVHIVRRGENLARIAHKYQISLNDLKSQNRIKTSSKLFVGARLIIPNAEAKVIR